MSQRMESELRRSQHQPKEQAGQQEPEKKVKISYEEYQKIGMLVVNLLKQAETDGQESMQQSEIVN